MIAIVPLPRVTVAGFTVLGPAFDEGSHVMMLISWIVKTLRREVARRPSQARLNRRGPLQMERLEDRSLPSYTLNVLANFNGPNGANPQAGLVEDGSGNLFGTTYNGGTHNDGTLFEWVKSSHTISVLVNFNGTNGANPMGNLTEDSNGNLFGTTANGGNGSDGNLDDGTVFEWVKSSRTLSVLVNINGAYGSDPTGGVVEDSSGNLFYTTYNSGDVDGGLGALFERVSGTVFGFHYLGSFNGTNYSNGSFSYNNAANPTGGLIEDSNGNLFGTTESGGNTYDGTVFEWVKSTNTITVLSGFNGTNGERPESGVIEDSSGNLFGTTYTGQGNKVDGTVFEWAKSTGTISDLAQFNGTNGADPQAGLVEDSSGNLFGTTFSGGAKDLGAVFEWVKSTGNIIVLANFNGTNGESPESGLIEDSSGNLFGTTYSGGAKGDGTVFELVDSPATRLAFTPPLPSTIPLGQALQVKVSAEQSNGTVDSDFYGSVTIQLSSGATFTETAAQGVATFPNLTLTAGTYTLQATSSALASATTSFVVAYTPAQIRHAYGFDTIPFLEKNGQPDAATYNANAGKGQTIAVVVLFNDPKIFQDLDVFDQAYGLPGPSTSFLHVFDQDGNKIDPATTTLPVDTYTPGQWEQEAALDVEWSHAIAPAAIIDLIECDYNADSKDYGLDVISKGAATAAANKDIAASVVSMSYFYGSNGIPSELMSETGYDGRFLRPSNSTGVTFLAATGDDGPPGGYPAYSPYVVAVGGTTLTVASDGSYGKETGWSNSGGGVSKYELQPQFQKAFGISSQGMRTIPDVSFDADPATGVYEYDSYPTPGNSTALTTGSGTSLATPCWAALIAIVDQGRTNVGLNPLDGATQTLPALYGLAPFNFNTIATNQYDKVTGLGTPKAKLLVPALVAWNVSPAPQSVPAGIVGHAYSQSIKGTGGSGQKTMSVLITGTTLPSDLGLTFTNNTNEIDITGTPTAPGTITFNVTATDSFGGAGTQSYTLQIVNAVTINNGSAQRSMVDSLTIAFAGVVTINPGAFILTKQNGVSETLLVSTSFVNGITQAVLTFTGSDIVGGSLSDGRYTLITVGSRILDANGAPIDAAGNGQAGSNGVDSFFRLFGDVSGSGTVSNADVLAFRQAYINHVYLSEFDFFGTGTLTTADFTELQLRLGKKV